MFYPYGMWQTQFILSGLWPHWASLLFLDPCWTLLWFKLGGSNQGSIKVFREGLLFRLCYWTGHFEKTSGKCCVQSSSSVIYDLHKKMFVISLADQHPWFCQNYKTGNGEQGNLSPLSLSVCLSVLCGWRLVVSSEFYIKGCPILFLGIHCPVGPQSNPNKARLSQQLEIRLSC